VTAHNSLPLTITSLISLSLSLSVYGLAIIYVCGRLKFGLATNAGLIKKIEVYNVHAMYALRYNKECPSAGSDDLGVWPLPQTPRGSIRTYYSSQPTKDFLFKRDKLAFFDKECSRIAEHIYLGSDTVAKNHELLRQNGITHMLNCVGFVCPEYFKGDFVYKTLWLQDSPTEDITSILYDVFDYFEDVREQGGRVLVHCCQGVSRSTALVIAYLMWREGQSFEDAFQFVKTARAVTNPNMGFACQLLQCQKRIHAMPTSPNSVHKMYRMAPHSPYDPLHLVPKMVNQPGARALDSRGGFIIHIPSAIYVWNGKHCNSVMSCNARTAAFQMIRYEGAKGPILTIHEGEEPPGFWIALSGDSDKEEEVMVMEEPSEGMESAELVDSGTTGPRKVDAYDLDFEIFHKALAGGVVPPFSLSDPGSETCLPAREQGWARLRRKFASGLLTSPKLNCDADSDPCNDHQPSVDVEVEKQDSADEPLSPSSIPPCGSPDSFECYPNREKGSPEAMDFSVHGVASSLPLSPPGTSNPFPCFISCSPKFNSKSPTLSPSSSDYASSFTFSPSSTNWSDLSFLSPRQPLSSGLESAEPFNVKDSSFSKNSSLLHKEDVPSPLEEFSANHTFGGVNSNLPMKGSFLSIAECRGSHPPSLMLPPSASESSHVPKNNLIAPYLCKKDGIVLHCLHVKESPSLWENPFSSTTSWKPCAERQDGVLPELPPENETNGYIFIHAEGGLNQQRIAICNAVAVAKILNATLILPVLKQDQIWKDQTKFEDIFDVDHFIDYLKYDVRIVRDIPEWFTDKSELFTSIRRTVKNIPKYAPAQFYIDNVLPRVKEKKIMALKPFVDRLGYDNVPPEINKLRCRVNYHALKFLPDIEQMANSLASRMRNRTGSSNPYMALHLRFEKGMVGLSFCDFVGTREEKAKMAEYRKKEWPRRYKNGSHLWQLALQKRKEGRCPLEPGEVAVILRAMGYPKETQIYVASGQVYGGQNRMAPLRNMFPNLVTKEELATKEELDGFRKHVTSLAALDFLVCLKSDVFVMTHGGNFAKLIIGARRYMGHRLKSIKPDKGLMSKSFGDPYMGWAPFVEDVVVTHQTRTGLPEETFPNYDLWENPLTPCMCRA
ncbi:DUF246 domain-containing protein, partial [Glycine soja]